MRYAKVHIWDDKYITPYSGQVSGYFPVFHLLWTQTRDLHWHGLGWVVSPYATGWNFPFEGFPPTS